MLQLLSPTKWFLIQISIIHDHIFIIEMLDCKIYQSKSGWAEMDEQKFKLGCRDL